MQIRCYTLMLSRFRHLHKKAKNEEIESSSSVKKVTFVLFALFLLLFPHYAPFDNNAEASNSIVQTVFNLYFFISNQTLGIIHESGHGVCYILHCPQFMTAANGTVFQIGFPLGVAYYYRHRGNAFAYYISLFFVGFSLTYTGWYIGTAHEGLHIPASKSFLGVDGNHDFNYILDSMGLLAYDGVISGLVKAGAYLCMLWAVIGMFLNVFESRQQK